MNDLEWPFYVTFCFLSIQVQNLLIYLYGQQHYMYGEIYLWKSVTFFSERRLAASVSSSIKQLDKILAACD